MNQGAQFPRLNVSQLINQNIGNWDESKIALHFAPIDQHQILATPILHENREDIKVWLSDEEGHFSIKQGYVFRRFIQQMEKTLQKL